MEAQRKLGADIFMAFDECTPYPATKDVAVKSLELTQRWHERAVTWLKDHPEMHGYPQYFFGIAQGGMHEELRAKAIEHLIKLDLPGYALGGLSVGEPAEEMYSVADFSTNLMPTNKPRYVMGVGTPANLLELISRGIDMFDCVLPTRAARHGTVFTWNGPFHYKAARHAKELDMPVDPDCSCYCCRNFSRAYLRHIFVSGEILALELATLHSLHFYQDLMRVARQQILDGTFEVWKDQLLRSWMKVEE